MTDNVPYAEEPERACLGALLINPALLLSVPDLEAHHFYLRRHGFIFAAMRADFDENGKFDNITLTERLSASGQLDEVGGASYLTSLVNATGTTAHLEIYAGMVMRLHTRRELIRFGARVMAAAQDETLDTEHVVANAEAEFNAAITGAAGRRTPSTLEIIDEYTTETLNALDVAANPNGVTGVPCGLTDLDRLTGGWHRDYFIVFGARPGMGKTSFGVRAIVEAMKRGYRVGLFSMEMGGSDMMRRFIAYEAGVPYIAQRSGMLTRDQQEATFKARDWFRGHADLLCMDHTPTHTHKSIELQAQVWGVRRPLDLIVVDYAQLMSLGPTFNNNRTGELTKITKGLKEAAMRLRVPIIAFAQLNRDLERRADKRPMLADLRESGSLEQDADVVGFLYRDAIYNDTSPAHEAEIIIAKHRNGPTGTVNAYWDAQSMRFEDAKVTRHDLRN